MNGKDLTERGLCQGIPLWRIEDELDWRENVVAARQSASRPRSGNSLGQPMFVFDTVYRFMEAGANRVLAKPVDPVELVRVLDESHAATTG